ncbi:MAG: type II toxin-antitoxin system MqsR family toxin [Rhodomicrobium sp.]
MNGKAQAILRACGHQGCVRRSSPLNRSFVSKQGADDLGIDDAGVVAAIQALTPADFEKSMTSMANSKVWQDVYKPDAGGRRLYVKFTLDARGARFLISFKEARDG